MENSIVAGMFGVSPNQIQQQRQAQINADANNFAQLDPYQQANQMLYKGGAGLAQAGAGMLGMQDPQMQQAQAQQAVMQGADTTTPEGMKALAIKLQSAGFQKEAMMAAARANEMESGLIKQQQEQAQTRLYDAQATHALQPPREGSKAALQKSREGVEGKPGWEREVMIDSNGQVVYRGTPYKVSAAITAGAAGAKDKQISNIDAKRISAVSTLGDSANPALQLLDQADALYGKYQSGLDEPILGRLGRVGAIAGIGGDEAADYETGGQIAKDLGVIKLGLIGGSDTERELKVAIDTSPSPDKRPSTNKTIIENQRRAINVLQAQPDFMSEWVAKHGSLSSLSSDGTPYGKAWRKYQKDNFQPVKTPSDATVTKQPANTQESSKPKKWNSGTGKWE